jgi:curved DNA-binding protein CbpA
MKYFKGNYENIGELRTEYYNLAKKYHPDMGGTDEAMKAINNEYEKLYSKVVSGQYENYEKWSEDFKEKFYHGDEELRAILDSLVKLPKIQIEVCGIWIWVTGETREVKEQLKSLKMRWSNNKKAWYWHPADYKKRSNKKYDLNEIRDMFGSHKVKKEEEEEAKQKQIA